MAILRKYSSKEKPLDAGKLIELGKINSQSFYSNMKKLEKAGDVCSKTIIAIRQTKFSLRKFYKKQWYYKEEQNGTG